MARRRGARGLAAIVAAAVVLVSALMVGLAPPGRADFSQVGVLPGLGAQARIWQLAFSPVDPNLALAATDNGVYRSTDAGATWVQSGVPGITVWAVAFDQRPDHGVYAGTLTSGLLASLDGGKSWQDASTGLPSKDVRSIASGTAGVVVGTDRGVALSADGRHWSSSPGLSDLAVSSVVVTANAPTFTLIAGVDGGDIPHRGYLFQSADSGATWKALEIGPSATDIVVSSVTVGPLPATATARPVVVVTTKGTFTSADGGANWTASQGIPTDPPVNLTTAAFSPVDPTVVFAGADAGGSSGGELLRSTDGGLHFSVADTGLGPKHKQVEAIAISPAYPPVVLIAIDQAGIAGQVWREVDKTAPTPPAKLGAEAAGVQPRTFIPTAAPTLAPGPISSAGPAPAGDRGSGGSGIGRRFLLIPVWIWVLLVALVAAYLLVRWWQRRREIEGPPQFG